MRWFRLMVLFMCLLASTGRSSDIKVEEQRSRTRFANEVAVEPGLTRMIEARIAAINARDKEAYLRTIHPRCLEAVTADNQDFYDHWFKRDLARTIPGLYRVSVTTISPDEPLLLEGELVYPVRATHMVMIDDGAVSLIWQVLRTEDQWYVVIPEPTAAVLEAFREKRRGLGERGIE